MIGRILDGRYNIIRVLSAGGFGHTYVAEDLRIPGLPTCVVKQLKPANTNTEFIATARRLFQTEAESLAKLGDHPQIPRLLAYFEEDQEFYLVQEYIEGLPISEELANGKRFGEDYVIELFQSILPILDFIHNQEVIHRDLKPDNIIRRQSDQELFLIDFGAVKQIQGVLTTTVTSSGTATIAIGTPGYMALEQAHGKPRPSSDIYALGAIALQALTGKKPSELEEDNQTGEICWQHLVNVRPGFATVLNRMVRYHFKDRYTSAQQVLQALQQINEPTLATIAINPPPRVIDPPPKVINPPPRAVTTTPRHPYPEVAPRNKQNNTWFIGSLVAFFLATGGGIGASLLLQSHNSELLPSDSDQSAVRDCLVTVSGNIRTEPSSRLGSQTVVATVSSQSLPITGTQTPGGWVEVFLNEQEVWAHRSIITNSQQMDTCLSENNISVETTPDLPSSPQVQPEPTPQRTPQPAPQRTPQPTPEPAPQPDSEIDSEPDSETTPESEQRGNERKNEREEERNERKNEREQGGNERRPILDSMPNTSPTEGVENYFSLINRNSSRDAWRKLSTNFQNKYSQGSYETFTNWWNQVENVRVLSSQVIEQNGTTAIVRTQYRYIMKDGRQIDESPKRFQMTWDASRRTWVINDQL